MMERVGREQLMAMVMARAPERAVSALASLSPEDTADLGEIRETLAALSLAAPAVTPPPSLKVRLLAARPRPRRPQKPVLLVLDMIQDHLTPGLAMEVPRARAIVPALQRRIAAARAQAMPIIYVCDTHEEGDPDYAEWPRHAAKGTPGAQVWPDLAPEPGDHLIEKPTYSAFTRSKLGPLLDALHADEIILTGCATELGLSITATDALQRGFVVTVPTDCQAGVSEMAEHMTLLTLSMLPPYDPRHLRKSA
ncbi:MAG: isochorismatase family cysteine hydrolase [Minicystis sp.]